MVVSADGENGVRITETIDQDFGTDQKHGPELVVPNDFGTPTDVTASSSDAPDARQRGAGAVRLAGAGHPDPRRRRRTPPSPASTAT